MYHIMDKDMNTRTTRDAYLEVILGPMFSGKTSRIIEIYKQCNICNIPAIIINHSLDARFGSKCSDAEVSAGFADKQNFVAEVNVFTHNNMSAPCFMTDSLMKAWANSSISDAEVILINEAQFFPDLYTFVQTVLQHRKRIYVCGLDGDFKREKFGQMLDIIPLCDKVEKLTSLCIRCKNGTPGIFSARVVATADTSQVLVGGSESYMSVCRKCYECVTTPADVTATAATEETGCSVNVICSPRFIKIVYDINAFVKIRVGKSISVNLMGITTHYDFTKNALTEINAELHEWVLPQITLEMLLNQPCKFYGYECKTENELHEMIEKCMLALESNEAIDADTSEE